jgi:hypothetical protein
MGIQKGNKMKIRIGFVSNSSSASFVIRWQNTYDLCAKISKELTEADRISISLMYLMDTGWMDVEDLSKVVGKNAVEEYDGYVGVMRYIFQNTKEIDKDTGLYESVFWTSMYNCFCDFGKFAAFLFLALELGTNATKISATVERDDD